MQDAAGALVSDPAAINALLLMHLRNYAAGGAMVIPAGVLKMLQAAGNGQVYLSALEFVDQQIVESILMSNLATEGGKYGTQALGEVHQDTKGLLIAFGKYVYLNTVIKQIVKPLVLWNYGQAGLEVLPHISIGETEQQDFATASTSYATLKNASILTPHQYNEMFEKLHITPLPQDVIDLLIQAWEASLQMGMQPQAVGPDGQPLPTDPNDPNAPMMQGTQPEEEEQPDTSLW
jgi:phage gp29-like protein